MLQRSTRKNNRVSNLNHSPSHANPSPTPAPVTPLQCSTRMGCVDGSAPNCSVRDTSSSLNTLSPSALWLTNTRTGGRRASKSERITVTQELSPRALTNIT